MERREHAVVIGASVSGMLAARVLAEEYDGVTVLDRDELPEGVENRRGVPQGPHPHALLARGRQIFDDFFPGLCDELLAGGAPLLTDMDDFQLEVLGHKLCQDRHDVPDPELMSVQPSRAFLESCVRARLRRVGNVEVRDRFTVRSPVLSPDNARTVGVAGSPADGAAEEVLPADLVVDASGRASRAPTWLRDWGYPEAAVDEV